MVKINLDIKKKDLWLLSAIMVFLIAVGYVIAYNSGAAPNVMGHSFGELEGVQARVTGVCAAGSSIRNITSSGAVVCEADDVGVTASQTVNGSVIGWVATDPSNGVCLFTWRLGNCGGGTPSCPSGSTLLQTGQSPTNNYYICVKN